MTPISNVGSSNPTLSNIGAVAGVYIINAGPRSGVCTAAKLALALFIKKHITKHIAKHDG
jgi:hypothetical protein